MKDYDEPIYYNDPMDWLLQDDYVSDAEEFAFHEHQTKEDLWRYLALLTKDIPTSVLIGNINTIVI